MGLTSANTTLVAPQPKGILDPRTGKPVGSDDAFFNDLNSELSDKGFIVTSADALITWSYRPYSDVIGAKEYPRWFTTLLP